MKRNARLACTVILNNWVSNEEKSNAKIREEGTM